MRKISLEHLAEGPSPRLARMVRHLEARLLDFGPGGPEVLSADQEAGTVTARFPGHDTAQVLEGLRARGISAVQQGGEVLFCLDPEGRFEDLDHLWGCLFELL